MQKTWIRKSQIQLVGIVVQTSYEMELDKMQGRILPCVQRYFHGALFDKIPKRTKPGTTFCAYTNYEADYRGSYTYFIGEEVSSLEEPLAEGLKRLVIPSQHYMKLTTSPAPMPDVIVNTWKEIWQMSSQEMGGERSYLTDFEIYDERAVDHQNIVLDVYVGVR